jgi:hypothetical protein
MGEMEAHLGTLYDQNSLTSNHRTEQPTGDGEELKTHLFFDVILILAVSPHLGYLFLLFLELPVVVKELLARPAVWVGYAFVGARKEGSQLATPYF